MRNKSVVDLRKRVGTLIKVIQEIPSRHRTPAMENLLTSLQRAAAEYDGGDPQQGDNS